jgi:hypothetical protein
MNFIFALLLVFLFGCQATSPYQKTHDPSSKAETQQDVRSAVESVAGAVAKTPMRVKYCPTCGRRFSPSVTTCPVDGAELKELE